MLKVTLANSSDKLDMNAQAENGHGMQIHAGMIGMGLPPVSGQWSEGAGDGATYRGGRVLTRDLDLPISLLGRDRNELVSLTSRLSRMFAEECKLTIVDTEGEDWYLMVRRVGGGNWVMGHDTDGERDLETVVTVRAGDPYWTSTTPRQAEVKADSSPKGLLTGSLATFQLAPSQAIGRIFLDNSMGDAPAYPSWVVEGPGDTFRAESPTGEVIQWNGTLLAGETLVVDARFNRVYNNATRENLYRQLAPAPRFWAIPPGIQRVTASINTPGPSTVIRCTWRPRKWAVV